MINVISVPYRGATFLNRNTNYNNRKELVISVPYRGATFLNRAWELVKKSAMTDFRPLSGSYISQSNVLSEYVKNVNFRPLSGSYISQYKCMVYRLQVIIFPSPIGELHFSIQVYGVSFAGHNISVPYRGATFLNYKTVKRFRRERLISVPYRGATFLNLNWNYGTFTTTNFRPLSGSYISQSGRLVHYIARYTISVPYRGATFLNRPLTARTEPEKNFRPLSGSYISQYNCKLLSLFLE